jgi:hypothetical protein
MQRRDHQPYALQNRRVQFVRVGKGEVRLAVGRHLLPSVYHLVHEAEFANHRG